MAPSDMSGKFSAVVLARNLANVGEDDHFGEPPLDPQWLTQLGKARELTLEERIKMRVERGIGWQWQL